MLKIFFQIKKYPIILKIFKSSIAILFRGGSKWVCLTMQRMIQIGGSIYKKQKAK